MALKSKEILYGLYDDETELLAAVRQAREKHLPVYDAYTPFPVHGLDHLMGLKESRLHQAGFIYGMLGTATAFGFMTWVFTRDWPMIFGGKPYWSVPAFIPITFELTVLFSAIGMTITYMAVNGMGPGVNNPVLDRRITDDKFALAFEVTKSEKDTRDIYNDFLTDTGAKVVNTKII